MIILTCLATIDSIFQNPNKFMITSMITNLQLYMPLMTISFIQTHYFKHQVIDMVIVINSM
jgi:hypothetical protein